MNKTEPFSVARFDTKIDVAASEILHTFLGTCGKIGGDIPAELNAIIVRANGEMSFEVVWWDGRTRKCEWVTPSEFKADA